MNFLRLADAWIGTKLFHPPIIWLCQRTGMSQYAIYRYLWWVAALWLVWKDDHSSKANTAFLAVFALVRTLSVGISINRPARPEGWVRILFFGFLAYDVIGAASGRGGATAQGLGDLLVLAAEYAATITTIPPQKKREDRRAAQGYSQPA